MNRKKAAVIRRPYLELNPLFYKTISSILHDDASVSDKLCDFSNLGLNLRCEIRIGCRYSRSSICSTKHEMDTALECAIGCCHCLIISNTRDILHSRCEYAGLAISHIANRVLIDINADSPDILSGKSSVLRFIYDTNACTASCCEDCINAVIIHGNSKLLSSCKICK